MSLTAACGWLARMCCDRLAAYYRFDTTPVTLIFHDTLWCGDALLWQGRSVVYKSETSGGQLSGQRPIEGLPGAGMCEVLRDLCSIVLFSTMLCNCAQFHFSASFTHTQSFSQALNMSDMVLQFCHSCTWHSPFWPPRVQSIVCHLLIIIFNSFRLDIHKFSSRVTDE